MTEQDARRILLNYREVDDETGNEYGYVIRKCCGKDGEGYIFQCEISDVNYDDLDAVFRSYPLIGVYPDGLVVQIPT